MDREKCGYDYIILTEIEEICEGMEKYDNYNNKKYFLVYVTNQLKAKISSSSSDNKSEIVVNLVENIPLVKDLFIKKFGICESMINSGAFLVYLTDRREIEVYKLEED